MPGTLSTPGGGVPAADGPAVGSTLAGRFLVHRLIAEGGMGVVYEAEDLLLRERVALKTVRPEIAGDPVAMARFRREIQLARRVTHPNVCRIFDVFQGQPDGGLPFFTMELVDGETLAERLRREGPLAEDQARAVALQLCQGLQAAHDAGVIHRDLKTRNVLLPAAARRVVLTDFGVARPLRKEDAGVTVDGYLVGTPAYMAPEQVEGAQPTAATDLYALGVVLYEMVTGLLPFDGSTALEVASKRLSVAPTPPRRHRPALDPGLESVILRCLARAPADRFASADELARALRDETVMPARVSVAILGFENASRAPAAAWMSTALAEMLATELAADLRVVGGDVVARVKTDLGLDDRATCPVETLERLRRLLDVSTVVTGAHLVAGGKVRLDVRVQGTARGELIAAFAESFAEAEIIEAVPRLAARLRAVLCPQAPAAPGGSRPGDPWAARLYAEGLDELRRNFDARAACDLLEQAVRQEPGFAPAHAALAQALTLLDYNETMRARARAEAAAASAAAVALPPADRLAIEAIHLELHGEWERAVATYREVLALHPDHPEHGVALARAQVRQGDEPGARVTLAELRRGAPVIADDPRLDLIDAELARDMTARLVFQERALARARARGARRLTARVLTDIAWTAQKLGDAARGGAAAAEAQEIYTAIRDRGGMAAALSARVPHRSTRSRELVRGRTDWREAARLWREIGDVRSAANATYNLVTAFIFTGELDQAEAPLGELRRLAAEATVANLDGLEARLRLERGELARAEAVLAAGTATSPLASTVAAEILVERGHPDGLRAIEALIAPVRASREVSGLLRIGETLLHAWQPAEALALFIEGRAMMRGGPNVFTALVSFYIAGMLAEVGRVAEAERELADHQPAGDDLGALPGLALIVHGARLRVLARVDRQRAADSARGLAEAIVCAEAAGSVRRALRGRLQLGLWERDAGLGSERLIAVAAAAEAAGFVEIARRASM